MSREENLEKVREEMVEVLAKNLPPHQVGEVRQLLSNYFAQKATEEFDRLAIEKGWNEETYENLLKERMRTPYDNKL